MRWIFATKLRHSAAVTCADGRGWPHRAGLNADPAGLDRALRQPGACQRGADYLVATFGGQDQTFRLRGQAQTLNSSGWSRRASDSAISRSPSAWVLRSRTRPRWVFSPMYLATREG